MNKQNYYILFDISSVIKTWAGIHIALNDLEEIWL